MPDLNTALLFLIVGIQVLTMARIVGKLDWFDTLTIIAMLAGFVISLVTWITN